MKNSVRVIAFSIVLVLMLSSCSGSADNKPSKGSESGPSSTDSSTNEVTQVTYEIKKGDEPKDPMVLDYIKEKFGITFNFVEVADSSTVMTQLAAGDVSDLVDGVKVELMTLDVESLFLPVSDYFDKLPNYVKYLEEDPDKECVYMLNDDGSKVLLS